MRKLVPTMIVVLLLSTGGASPSPYEDGMAAIIEATTLKPSNCIGSRPPKATQVPNWLLVQCISTGRVDLYQVSKLPTHAWDSRIG